MINNFMFGTLSIMTLINVGISFYLINKNKKIKEQKYLAVIYNKNTKETVKIINIKNETDTFETSINGKDRKYNIDFKNFISIPSINTKLLIYLVENADPVNLTNVKSQIFQSDVYSNIIHNSLVKQMTDAVKQSPFNNKYLLYGGVAILIFIVITMSGGL